MKRSLTIGCVLLVGGGAANCGGVITGTAADQEAGGHVSASGSGAAAGGFVGDGTNYAGGGGFVGDSTNYAGGGGVSVGAVGVQVGVGGGTPWVDPCSDGVDPQCFVGVAGAGGDLNEPSVGAGAGPVAGSGGEVAGSGGESGWIDEPPPGGSGPTGGTGGWVGVPPN